MATLENATFKGQILLPSFFYGFTIVRAVSLIEFESMVKKVNEIPDENLHDFAKKMFQFIQGDVYIHGVQWESEDILKGVRSMKESHQRYAMRKLVPRVGNAVRDVFIYHREKFRKKLEEDYVKYNDCMKDVWEYIVSQSSAFFSDTSHVIENFLKMSAYLLVVSYFLREKECMELVDNIPQVWKEVFIASCKEKFLDEEGWWMLSLDAMSYANACVMSHETETDKSTASSSGESQKLPASTQLPSSSQILTDSLDNVNQPSVASTSNVNTTSCSGSIEVQEVTDGRDIYTCIEECFINAVEEERTSNEGRNFEDKRILNQIFVRFLKDVDRQHQIKTPADFEDYLDRKLNSYVTNNYAEEDILETSPPLNKEVSSLHRSEPEEHRHACEDNTVESSRELTSVSEPPRTLDHILQDLFKATKNVYHEQCEVSAEAGSSS